MTRLILASIALALVGQLAAFAQQAAAPAAPATETPAATPAPATPAPQTETPPVSPVPAATAAAPASTWQYPLDAAVAADGTYYIADRKLPGIWKLKDGVNSVFYQGNKKYRTPMNAVRCVHVAADGTLYAGDSATREVYSISASGEAKALTNGQIGIPTAIAVVDGTVYVTDLELHRIWKFPAAGLPITKQPEEFTVVGGCRGMFVDGNGFIWVLSSLKPQLRKYTGDGKFETVVDDLVFDFPHQVYVTKDGTAYVTDGYAKAIWKIAPGGKPEKWVSGEPLVNPVGIRQQGDDFIVCDSRANALFKITPDAKIEKIFGGPPNPLPVVPLAVATEQPATTPTEAKRSTVPTTEVSPPPK